MPGSPPSHHFILGSVLTFKYDLSALEHLWWIETDAPVTVINSFVIYIHQTVIGEYAQMSLLL